MVEIVEHEIVQEPEAEAEAQASTTQTDDTIIETQLAQQISDLWSDHARLSADQKATAKELRQIRATLAERLYEMKSLLSRPGRSGQWRSWLRQRHIPRSTADRLASRHGETQGIEDGNVPNGAIPNSPEDSAGKLAKSVWQRFRKTLATYEAVIQFIDQIAELSGVGHERREGGLMIFCPVHKAADGVIGTDAAVEVTALAPQHSEGEGGNPADPPATAPAPPPSDEVCPHATQEPSGDVAATPAEVMLVAAASDVGQSSSGDVVTP
jgi:hypothetical protein